MPPFSKRWQVSPPAPPGHIARLSHLHPITVQVLYNRGIVAPDDVAEFLAGGGREGDPFDLDDMPAAVTRLQQALRAGDPIAVYGDFDADGVTATVLLTQTLLALGGSVQPYIPHRVDEGYGLNKEALTRLAQEGIRLVVTVDCGVRSVEEVAYANRLGLDVIVTDHHSVGNDLPPAVAVINPKRPDNRYPFTELAGVGLAYKLAQALLHNVPPPPAPFHLKENDLMDLVALGTVADLAPLLGENRTLVRLGLKSINQTERPGIQALCRHAGLQPGRIDTLAIGYALGPRLNAAGRLAHANTAYRLLETPYPAEAEQLAEELNRLNDERQQLTKATLERARQQALDTADDAPLLFAAAPDFPAGVVGLVANQLVEEFYRPAIIVEMGNQVSHGSARSIPEFHITRALDTCADLLIRYGGHAAAAGFTVANENLSALTARLRAIAREQLAGAELIPTLTIDAEVELSQISGRVYQELAQLEPCGYANPHPLFLSRNVQVKHCRVVGSDGKHLKLKLYDRGITWDAIAFRQGEWAADMPTHIDMVYHLELNEWNGEKRLQLNIQDMRAASCKRESPLPLAYTVC